MHIVDHVLEVTIFFIGLGRENILLNHNSAFSYIFFTSILWNIIDKNANEHESVSTISAI